MSNVIFLAFADENPDSLPALEEEYNRLRELLSPLDAREYIKLVPHGKTSQEQFFNTLNQYTGQLNILHFSGHASGEHIALSDGAGFTAGLATLLSQEPQFQLLVLNGCATRGHVAQMLAAGVPAVIATSAPVGDQQASYFSVAFYRALVNKKTILEAFTFARAELEFRFKHSQPLEVRGLGFLDSEDPSDELLWGLYTATDGPQDALHWRLPYCRDSGLSELLKQDIQQRVTNNQYIVRVLDRMCQVNKDITANYLVKYVDGQAHPVDPSNYLDAVIQNFPWVIGAQIVLLRQKLLARRDRLEQLLSTYFCSSQLLYFILLADCWEQKTRKHWTFEATPSFAELPRSAAELKHTNFCGRLLALYHWMSQTDLPQGVSFFAPELAKYCVHLADPDHRLFKACQDLQQLSEQHAAGNKFSDWTTVCERAEKALTYVLSEMAFLAAYHFLTVRNIFLENAHTKPLEYDLEMGKLNTLAASSLGIYQDASYRRKSNYTNSKSIVLTPSERDLQFALPLTPFLIDANTFLGEPLPYLFLFAYVEDDRYYYYSVNHDFYTAIEGGKGFDLIHTGLSKEDFMEGNNDSSMEEEDNWMDDDFLIADHSTLAAKTRIFTLLEEQHVRFRSDFTPYSKP